MNPTPSSSQIPEITVIIPVYQEAGAISATVRGIQALGPEWKVIVVDDGSTDGSFEEAKATGVTVLRHHSNRGYGAALKSGIKAAHTEWVAIIDADGTYPPEELPKLWAAMGDADMTVGARVGFDAQIPMIRRPAKWFLRKLAEFLVDTPIPDLNSGIRIMRRSLVLKFLSLLPRGFSFTTTLTMSCLSSEHPVNYVGTVYLKRKGQSKIKPIRDSLNFLVLILRIATFFNPLRVFIPAAVLVFGLGMVSLATDLATSRFTSKTALLFMTSLQIGLLGLLAEAIAARDRISRS